MPKPFTLPILLNTDLWWLFSSRVRISSRLNGGKLNILRSGFVKRRFVSTTTDIHFSRMPSHKTKHKDDHKFSSTDLHCSTLPSTLLHSEKDQFQQEQRNFLQYSRRYFYQTKKRTVRWIPRWENNLCYFYSTLLQIKG